MKFHSFPTILLLIKKTVDEFSSPVFLLSFYIFYIKPMTNWNLQKFYDA